MTLAQIYKKYPTGNDCLKLLESIRWQNKPVCPYCKVSRFSLTRSKYRYHCNSCNTSFSVMVGTIFHRTHVDLQKWFLLICFMLNAKEGVSARQLVKDIKVNKNTAWFMMIRIRRALFGYRPMLEKIVEAN